jgi:hypothetical protein
MHNTRSDPNVSRDPSAWPQKRDFKTFQQWFSIELHSVVEDVVADALIDDESEL